MQICFTVLRDEGLQSIVYDHFGSAPVFLIIDSETGKSKSIPNTARHHGPGACTPFKILDGVEIDAVVTGNIGFGAVMKCTTGNIRVFHSSAPTVGENLDLLSAGALREVILERACPGGKRGCSYH